VGPGGSERGKNVKVATFNIINGRTGNTEVALRAIAQVNVDIAICTETKLTGDRYTKYSHGYEVITTTAKSLARGGVLAYCDDEAW
jgi:exonuclease III